MSETRQVDAALVSSGIHAKDHQEVVTEYVKTKDAQGTQVISDIFKQYTEAFRNPSPQQLTEMKINLENHASNSGETKPSPLQTFNDLVADNMDDLVAAGYTNDIPVLRNILRLHK